MKDSILFGNGINLLSKENKSWTELLKEIKGTYQFENGPLPNTMIYERILFEKPITSNRSILNEESKIKEAIAKAFSSISNHPIYRELYKLKAHNYLTTNYDYAFRNSIAEYLNYKDVDKSTEDIYSIRRKIEIHENGYPTTNLWHIHGEINKPKTIMLGLDHYCGEIGKIDNFIKGSYEFQQGGKTINLKSIEEKLISNEFDDISWVELFFSSNIHIIGFSFDYSEIDLWWILTKRARMKKDLIIGKKIRNNIFYYCDFIEESKKGLFKSLGVQVIELPKKKDDWELNYHEAIQAIRNNINRPDKAEYTDSDKLEFSI